MNILTATSGVGILATLLLTMDARVREQAAQILSGHGNGTEIGTAAWTVQSQTAAMLDLLRDQSLAYAPLTAFGIAAIVLFFFMLKS